MDDLLGLGSLKDLDFLNILDSDWSDLLTNWSHPVTRPDEKSMLENTDLLDKLVAPFLGCFRRSFGVLLVTHEFAS